MLTVLLIASGLFTLALGVVHIFMPVLFDFRNAIPRTGPPIKDLRLLFYTYPTRRSDIHGIAWVMNHAASYVLISIGVIDLLANRWIDHEWAWMIAGWISGWWFLRALTQLYLGRRRGDLLIMMWFMLLAIIHLVAAVQSLN